MDFNEFQELALRTAGTHPPLRDGVPGELVYSALGLVCEAGEYGDHVKKIAFHGHALDVVAQADMLDELGDVLWYLAASAQFAGLSLDRVAEFVIAKLRRRYPDGFSSERSVHRAENDPTEASVAPAVITGVWLWDGLGFWRYNGEKGHVVVQEGRLTGTWVADVYDENGQAIASFRASSVDDAKFSGTAALNRTGLTINQTFNL